MAKTVFHSADSRGLANHGWLNSRHTFSFGGYYDPQRMHFGVLRVLNDDQVAPGMGFGTHPHDNMEIISIPLQGELEHRDNMGNVSTIKKGDIQVMSAGTGVQHSEYNKSKTDEVRFLQIWLFPKERNVTPRYDQISLNQNARKNQWQQLLSPHRDDEGVWIHQDAWFHMIDMDENTEQLYHWKKEGNGLYVFVLNGSVVIDGQTLQSRDGLGITDANKVQIHSTSSSSLLLMEVPMH